MDIVVAVVAYVAFLRALCAPGADHATGWRAAVVAWCALLALDLWTRERQLGAAGGVAADGAAAPPLALAALWAIPPVVGVLLTRGMRGAGRGVLAQTVVSNVVVAFAALAVFAILNLHSCEM